MSVFQPGNLRKENVLTFVKYICNQISWDMPKNGLIETLRVPAKKGSKYEEIRRRDEKKREEVDQGAEDCDSNEAPAVTPRERGFLDFQLPDASSQIKPQNTD